MYRFIILCFISILFVACGEYEKGYHVGLEKGKTDGYDEGYDEGHRDGYNEGYDEGRSEGYNNGYDEGQQEEKYCYTCGEYIY